MRELTPTHGTVHSMSNSFYIHAQVHTSHSINQGKNIEYKIQNRSRNKIGLITS